MSFFLLNLKRVSFRIGHLRFCIGEFGIVQYSIITLIRCKYDTEFCFKIGTEIVHTPLITGTKPIENTLTVVSGSIRRTTRRGTTKHRCVVFFVEETPFPNKGNRDTEHERNIVFIIALEDQRNDDGALLFTNITNSLEKHINIVHKKPSP